MLEAHEALIKTAPEILWAEAESLHNSQCKPVNNCGGSRIFLKLWFEIWKSGGRPQKRAAGLLRMDLN
jgi:hypothetical protein